MKLLKKYPIVYKKNSINGKIAEVEYRLKNGNVVSVIDLRVPENRIIYKHMQLEIDKDYSVELLDKDLKHRIILVQAQQMTYDELVAFCKEHDQK